MGYQHQKLQEFNKNFDKARQLMNDEQRYRIQQSVLQYKTDTRDVYDRIQEIKDKERQKSKRAYHEWGQNQGLRDLNGYRLESIFAGSQGRSPL